MPYVLVYTSLCFLLSKVSDSIIIVKTDTDTPSAQQLAVRPSLSQLATHAVVFILV
jgi:hypothetical protein